VTITARPAIVLTALCAAQALRPAAAQHRLGGVLVDGSVVRVHGCGSHFFIAYRNEYDLAEWLGGEMVRENDVLQLADDQGGFEREGRVTLTNIVTGRQIDIMIEKALMNTNDYAATVGQLCQ
jgi:hypothetical protein